MVIDGGGVVIDDGGTVEVWCSDGGAVGIMPSLKSRLERNNKERLKNRILGRERYY